jgi:hypothetical protein
VEYIKNMKTPYRIRQTLVNDAMTPGAGTVPAPQPPTPAPKVKP